jgi:hypothetical protein
MQQPTTDQERWIELEIDGRIWHHVPDLSEAGPQDQHYEAHVDEEGRLALRFGDGEHGARLPAGLSTLQLRFDPGTHYSGIVLKQGAVEVDQDWNEADTRVRHPCGVYRARVIDNRDPSGLMRVRVEIPEVLGPHAVWALPCMPVGASALPTIGQGVWVAFEAAHPSRPVWVGTWPAQQPRPSPREV